MFKKLSQIILCICLTLLLSACAESNYLSSTQWVGGYGGANFEMLLMDSDFVIKVEAGNGSYSTYMEFSGSYVYSSPNLTGIITTRKINGVSYAEGQSFNGIVNGKTMTITGLFTDSPIEFIRR